MCLADADVERGHDVVDQVATPKSAKSCQYSSAPRTCTLLTITQRSPSARNASGSSVAIGKRRMPGTAGAHSARRTATTSTCRIRTQDSKRPGKQPMRVLHGRAVILPEFTTKHGQGLCSVDPQQQPDELL